MRLVSKICLVWLMLFGVSTSVWAQRSASEIKGSQAVSPQVKAIKVVASFSILADMVKQIGGDAVEVFSMVGYGADAHVFSPTPADVRQIAQAKWVVTNGLGFEGWMNRLIVASGYKGPVLVASEGVMALVEDHKLVASHNEKAHAKSHSHDHHDDQDPHAWQSLKNAKIYVENIRAGLVQLLPESRAAIDQRASDYQARIDALDQYTHQAFYQIPLANRRVMTTHDAFGYFAASYQIEFLSIQGWSTDREPSAAQVGQLIRQIRQDRIKALFFEHLADTRLVERIADETGAKLGGTLYVDALTPPGTPADTYLKMFALNVETILKTLR
jgi:zinc/manganese transport system substrate-binding protein